MNIGWKKLPREIAWLFCGVQLLPVEALQERGHERRINIQFAIHPAFAGCGMTCMQLGGCYQIACPWRSISKRLATMKCASAAIVQAHA